MCNNLPQSDTNALRRSSQRNQCASGSIPPSQQSNRLSQSKYPPVVVTLLCAIDALRLDLDLMPPQGVTQFESAAHQHGPESALPLRPSMTNEPPTNGNVSLGQLALNCCHLLRAVIGPASRPRLTLRLPARPAPHSTPHANDPTPRYCH